MDNEEIADYRLINSRLFGQGIRIPKMLYKYRPFDTYTFDMLENDYLYLCKAEKLDDPSECETSLPIKDYYDLINGRLHIRVVDGILDYLRPHATDNNFKQICRLVYRCMAPDGHIMRNCLLHYNFDMQKLVPDVYFAPFVNFLGNIPDIMNRPEMKKNIEKLLLLAHVARSEMGICSLTELSDSPEMWDNYARESTGCCIQYSMEEYDYNDGIYPVVYTNERDTNILSAIIGSYIGRYIFSMTNGRMDVDESQFIRLFITKDTSWKYQKEWRVIGDAGEKIKAPKIEAIHIGKNVSEENAAKMKEYCKRRGIALIQK